MPPADASAETDASAEPDDAPVDHGSAPAGPGSAERSGSGAGEPDPVEDTLDLKLTEELLALIAEERNTGADRARDRVPQELLGDPGAWPPAATTAGSSRCCPSGRSAISPSSAAG